MTTIAVMQPYFVPYAGYFRLFACADLVVLYDCVQFPRRGWAHRNRLPDDLDRPQWLTLPLARAPREALIADLAFRPEAEAEMHRQARAFPSLRAALARRDPFALSALSADGSPVERIEALLGEACARLELPFTTMRSSALNIPATLRGQDRILAIVRALGGDRYVNPPGGRALYDSAAFAQAGVDLRFLVPHPGPSWSILHRLLEEPAAAVAAEIHAGSILES